MDDERKLSFEYLDEQIEQYRIKTNRDIPGKWERSMFALGAFSGGAGAAIGTLLANSLGLAIIRAAFIAECVFFLVCLILLVRRNWRTFVRARRTYSQELDQDYSVFRSYVAWLRRFSHEEIRRRLRYVELRRNSMVYRMGLFTGGMEKLGVVPVLIVLYLQFKDWRFADWEALSKVNMVGGLLLWGLLLGYLLSWYLVGLKSRLDIYEALMREAVHRDD